MTALAPCECGERRATLAVGAAWKSPGAQASKSGEVYACRRSLVEPDAARLAGIAVFKSLLLQEACLVVRALGGEQAEPGPAERGTPAELFRLPLKGARSGGQCA